MVLTQFNGHFKARSPTGGSAYRAAQHFAVCLFCHSRAPISRRVVRHELHRGTSKARKRKKFQCCEILLSTTLKISKISIFLFFLFNLSFKTSGLTTACLQIIHIACDLLHCSSIAWYSHIESTSLQIIGFFIGLWIVLSNFFFTPRYSTAYLQKGKESFFETRPLDF